MATAAGHHGVDPDRISFTHPDRARHSVRARLGPTTTTALSVALPATVAEINTELVRTDLTGLPGGLSSISGISGLRALCALSLTCPSTRRLS